MTFTIQPLTHDNLPRCAPFWADRSALSPAEFAEVSRRLGWLLEQGRAKGSLILFDDEPRSYGVSAFIQEAAADALLDSRQPRLGSQLLLRDDFSAQILGYDEIARRNPSGQGLQLIVLNTSYRFELGHGQEALGLTMKAFVDDHQGYRLTRVVGEVFGAPAIAAMGDNGSFLIHGRYQTETRSGPLESQTGTMTRESAMRATIGLLPMFVYTPPQVRYTRSEQELLSLALTGGTDEWLRQRLGSSLPAVKSRWLRIQQRTATQLPHLFADVTPGSIDGRRGARTRHIILDYIRRTPSELTPYDARYEPAD